MEAQERGRSMERSILIPILLFLHVPWIEEAFMMGYRFMGTASLLLCVHRPVEMGSKGGKTVRGGGTRFYVVFGGVNVERRGIWRNEDGERVKVVALEVERRLWRIALWTSWLRPLSG